MRIIKITKQELKKLYIEDFFENDYININNKYIIHIKYGKYDHPSLETTVSDFDTMKELSCTAGVRGGRPYFIDNFISRRRRKK